jgi:hypothetical protein
MLTSDLLATQPLQQLEASPSCIYIETLAISLSANDRTSIDGHFTKTFLHHAIVIFAAPVQHLTLIWSRRKLQHRRQLKSEAVHDSFDELEPWSYAC